ncbi:tryptophan synthase subunit alpha [Saccharibacter floricola]|uniref:Tryptophan synthase alpha chain n=1 Tax=Saccharibacter floricola DSM 15669 TaxID=1123227 RepID=A0ABQ0NYK9_9PROT|nr:tryptophan synthase subunit alpha [Saccharibacter floricola]GBQ06413.1 tryptophan synthase subunit alpha [Saccharibacter floricola DSM 15669]
MSRIKACFDALKAEGRGALIPYLEAFDPDRDTSQKLLNAMPEAGADIIEVGVPFSDPSADGPTIQLAAQRGLKAGATLAGVLDMVAQFRRTNDHTPIVLMGYLNPIDHYGVERFCQEAARSGVDGLIVVDLPPEEAGIIRPHTKANALDLITLTAPTTPDERLKAILADASGFVYYVSITGITGTNTATEDQLTQAMTRLRRATDIPVVAGFGIRTPEQARTASRITDGAVVASAIIKAMAATFDDGQATDASVPTALGHISRLSKAVRNA